MKRILFTMLMLTAAHFANSQSTYYWVGGLTPTAIQSNANWNTMLDGSGSSRSGASNPDILIFDGSNVGGATPTTGLVAGPIDGGMACAQIRFINAANVRLGRNNSGTGTLNILGDGVTATEDFIIESGASLLIQSTTSSLRLAMAAANKGRVSGNLSMILPMQARFDNTTAGTPGSFRFTAGSTFTTDITGSSSYAFGSSTQSSSRWVVFESGAHLYYNGGNSPHGSGANFSAIDMQPGSIWHHRGNNTGLAGNFFNRQFYGDISIENSATLTASNSIYRIGNLSIEAGASYVPYTAGQTVVTGNINANGNINLPTAGNNRMVLAGNAMQTIAGAGNIALGSLVIANDADVTLNKNLAVESGVEVYGKINFNASQITGNASFTANGITTPLAATANTVIGNTFITGNAIYTTGTLGQLISGPGIAANTNIVAFSSTADTVYLSRPLTASASGIAVSATSTGATLATSNANGFDPTNGSITSIGNHSFENNINYIINGPTTKPFGISTGSTSINTITGFTDINATVTVNTNLSVSQRVSINGKLTLRPLDTLHILTGASITGTFGASNYIVTGYNTVSGAQALIRYDGLTDATIPLGTDAHYLPAHLDPTGQSDLSINVFEGITTNGLITGTPFTTLQQQSVVNAVWTIGRTTAAVPMEVRLGWTAGLEGTAFSALPGTDIGVIQNSGALWSAPLAPGDNVNNTASATVNTVGAFGVGAVAQVAPFVFNDLPVKTYGDADFNGGATSLNTTQPILYSSDNATVATIVAGAIHITGAGTANITASQASDGFYPAASVTKTLTVNKATLTITADNKTKFEALPNPVLTATYTGFVLGENASVLLTPIVLTTTAVTSSLPGNYPITVSGATSNNYTINFVDGVLTVQPKQNQTITFNALTARNYGAANFTLVASSTNNTIPIVFTSSNTAVATVTGNVVHIVGAGTTDITASQAGNDGYFPAINVTRTFTVNKVGLTVRARDTTKIENTPNPGFVITYTGFVLGETAANLTTPPSVTTPAQTNSSPGYYSLTPGGAVSQNYNFTYVPGRLTVLPAGDTTKQFLYVFVNAAGNLNVRTYSPKPTLADIYLFDMNGRLVRKKNLFLPKGFVNSEMSLDGVSNGVYVVAVRGNGVDLTKSISIVR